MKIEDYVNAEELKRLLQSLVVFLVAVSIFGLFGFIVVPGLRNANSPPVAPPVEAVAGETGWLDPTEYPPAKGYEIPPLDPKTVLTPTPQLLERGGNLYTKNCAQCHGDDGRGQGPASAGLAPPPRNFTSPDGWKNGYGRPGIFKTLAEGISGGSMAAFDYLRPNDRMALVHYVRSLGKFRRDPEEAEAIEALSKQLARPGGRVPNKIPVSMAAQKLAEEYEAPASLELPPAKDTSPGAQVLRRAVDEPGRAARSLSGAPAWREGPDRLARIVAAGVPSNGFSVRTRTFRPTEWKALGDELIKRIGR